MSRGSFTKSEIDSIRDRTRISDIIGKYVTWDRKKTNVGRGDYWGCCPFHGEKRPSFHCEDRKGKYHCFGCGVDGDVFRFLTEKTGCSFPEAVEMLGGQRELREETSAEKARRERQERERREAAELQKMNEEDRTRTIARRIWDQTKPLEDTVGHLYFIKRDIGFAVQFSSLRFHPALEYYNPETNKVEGKHPGVVAGLQDPNSDRFLGIWRIYLTPEGENLRDHNGAKVKLGLGAYAEYGGCVRLGDPVGQRVNVCEGIETGLGIYGITGGIVCPALNTSGMKNFVPPKGATGMLIWPDGDVDRFRKVGDKEKHFESPGIKAAKALRRAAEEWRPDFPCAIQPTPKSGKDYLDVWQAMKRKMK